MKELIERLRKGIVTSAPYEPQYTVPPVKICLEAADELEHLTEMVEQLIVGAVACVEVVVENERLFSENKLLNYKLEEEQKKTATLSCVLAEPLLATIQRTVRTGAKEMSLIDRLRDTASKGISAWGDLQLEAADEIERLTAEEKMQLEQIVNQGLEIERLTGASKSYEAQANKDCLEIERLTVLAYHQGLEIKWLTAERDTLKESATEWNHRYIDACQQHNDRQTNLGHQIVALEAERDAYRSWGSQNEASFSAECNALKSALLGAQALIAELQSERVALTDNLARAKEYHAGELADVVAERDSLQAQLTNIWI